MVSKKLFSVPLNTSFIYFDEAPEPLGGGEASEKVKGEKVESILQDSQRQRANVNKEMREKVRSQVFSSIETSDQGSKLPLSKLDSFTSQLLLSDYFGGEVRKKLFNGSDTPKVDSAINDITAQYTQIAASLVLVSKQPNINKENPFSVGEDWHLQWTPEVQKNESLKNRMIGNLNESIFNIASKYDLVSSGMTKEQFLAQDLNFLPKF